MFSERDLVRKPDMRRVNIPISLDMAFEALANLAGDSGGAGGDGTFERWAGVQESSAAWAGGGTGPVKLEGCSNVTPFAAGTCMSMGRSGLSSVLVPGTGTAVLLAATGHCQGLRRGCCPREWYQLREPWPMLSPLWRYWVRRRQQTSHHLPQALPGSHLVDNTAPDSQPHSPATPT